LDELEDSQRDLGIFQLISTATTSFDFPKGTFDVHNCPEPVNWTTATTDELLTLYKQMITIRRIEMACDQVLFSLSGI
jgi:hypothetical protein